MQIPLDWYRNGWVSQPFPAQAFKHGVGVFDKESGLLQGTVELLVLKTLSWGPMHGYGIASWIESATSDVLRVEEDHSIPRSTAWRAKGGSSPSGASRRTTVEPSSTT